MMISNLDQTNGFFCGDGGGGSHGTHSPGFDAVDDHVIITFNIIRFHQRCCNLTNDYNTNLTPLTPTLYAVNGVVVVVREDLDIVITKLIIITTTSIIMKMINITTLTCGSRTTMKCVIADATASRVVVVGAISNEKFWMMMKERRTNKTTLTSTMIKVITKVSKKWSWTNASHDMMKTICCNLMTLFLIHNKYSHINNNRTHPFHVDDEFTT